jgi:hypothetical protein
LTSQPEKTNLQMLGARRQRISTAFATRPGIGRWITFYNYHRPHTAHGGQPPAVVYFNIIETDQQVQAVA